MRQRDEGLIERGGRLAMGRVGKGPVAGLTEIAESLLPQFSPQRVVGNAVHLLRQTVVAKRHFHRLDDLRMDNATALLEETAVGHLVCQGMLEGVFKIREKGGLVEKFRGL